jgi:hypothetical protein
MKTIQTQRSMEQYDVDKMIAICSGVVGGMIMFINTYLLDASFIISLSKAAATAFICGLAGLAGKEFFSIIKTKYFNRKQKNKPS